MPPMSRFVRDHGLPTNRGALWPFLRGASCPIKIRDYTPDESVQAFILSGVSVFCQLFSLEVQGNLRFDLPGEII